MSANQESYPACLAYAADQGEVLMKELVDATRQRMFRRITDLPDTLERDKLKNAFNLLTEHESAMCRQFSELLRVEFASGAPADTPKVAARVAPSFDQLELMDDEQVQERVEVAGILQSTVDAVEFEIGEFNSLVCGAQGLEKVTSERNPMRPEVYARTLRAVLLQTREPLPVRLLWMQHMGALLGEGLVTTYRALCRMLLNAGVKPAGFLVTMVRGGTRVGAAATTVVRAESAQGEAALGFVQSVVADPVAVPDDSGRAKHEQGGHAEKLLTLEHLRQLLAGDFSGGRGKPQRQQPSAASDEVWAQPGPAFSPTLPAAFEALQEMKQVDAVIQRLADRHREGPAAAPATPVHAGQGHEPPGPPRLDQGQALSREVVSLMVDNIAGDLRLLEPMREAVRTLEPALLRLALRDPRFFSDRQHAARRLLDEMTQRSLGFDRVGAAGFDVFIEPVRSAVEALASIDVDGPEPFEVALSALREEWGIHAGQEQVRHEKAVQALQSAERRGLLAGQIFQELRERSDLRGASADVEMLLLRPWSQVMAHARLSHPQAGSDPGGFGAVVADLIWSTQPELAARNRSGLARMIPGLIQKLRAGLDSIDFPAARADAFFSTLMSLHQQGLGSSDAPAATVSGAVTAPSDLHADFDAADDPGVWMTGDEARDSGFFDDLPDAASGSESDSPYPSTSPMGLPTHTSAPSRPMLLEAPEAGFEALTVPGAWIELWLNGAWERSQLTWASPQGKLFMYTSVTGGAHSITLRSLKRLHDEGVVRLIAGQALLDGALDAVAQAALRNSIDLGR